MTESSAHVLVKSRIRAGVWEGEIRRLDGAEAPAPVLEARHLDRKLEGLALDADPRRSGIWIVRLPIATEILNEGVQTIMILDATSQDRLASFTLVTGEPIEDDIRAEVELLRAELDMLKRAFRRHCVETA